MEVKVFLKIFKNGELVLQQPSKCILSNFRWMLYDWLTLAVNPDWTNYPYERGFRARINAPDNDDRFGIVVGSGAMPVTPDDTSLSEKITHGTGTGQLDYDNSEVSYEVDYVNKRGYIYVKRSFKNLSDSDVIVRECGIVAHYVVDRGYRLARDKWLLIVRDVLSEPITVHPYEQLVIHYTFQIG